MPLTKSVKKNRQLLEEAHPDWPEKRLIAAALEAARQQGNRNIKYPNSLQKRRSK